MLDNLDIDSIKFKILLENTRKFEKLFKNLRNSL